MVTYLVIFCVFGCWSLQRTIFFCHQKKINKLTTSVIICTSIFSIGRVIDFKRWRLLILDSIKDHLSTSPRCGSCWEPYYFRDAIVEPLLLGHRSPFCCDGLCLHFCWSGRCCLLSLVSASRSSRHCFGILFLEFIDWDFLGQFDVFVWNRVLYHFVPLIL